jgi:heptosyltransferase III
MKPLHERYVYKHPFKRQAAGFFDALGSLYRRLRPHKTPPFDPASVEKILLIRLDHLGDVIMTRPAIDAVRAHFPKASIDLLVSSDTAELFTGDPSINLVPVTHHWFSRRSSLMEQITEMEDLVPMLRRERYDVGIDFRGDLRHILLMSFAGIRERIGYGITGGDFLLTRKSEYDRTLHQVESNMKLLSPLGIESIPKRRSFAVGASQKHSFFNFQDKSSASVRVILHPGAGLAEKKWPQENFQILIRELLQRYASFHVLLIGTREEKNSFAVLEQEGRLTDLRGKTKLSDLPALFDASHLYIGNDSGPAHLAAFQGMAGIIIFSGINDPNVWKPWSERFHIITDKDIQTISPEQVMGAVERLLESDKGLSRIIQTGKSA